MCNTPYRKHMLRTEEHPHSSKPLQFSMMLYNASKYHACEWHFQSNVHHWCKRAPLRCSIFDPVCRYQHTCTQIESIAATLKYNSKAAVQASPPPSSLHQLKPVIVDNRSSLLASTTCTTLLRATHAIHNWHLLLCPIT